MSDETSNSADATDNPTSNTDSTITSALPLLRKALPTLILGANIMKLTKAQTYDRHIHEFSRLQWAKTKHGTLVKSAVYGRSGSEISKRTLATMQHIGRVDVFFHYDSWDEESIQAICNASASRTAARMAIDEEGKALITYASPYKLAGIEVDEKKETVTVHFR